MASGTTKGVSLSMKIQQYLMLGLWLALLVCPVQAASAQALQVTNGLRLWLDAADVNNGAAQPGSGAAVSTWFDKSGLNNNVVASGNTSATFETAGLNGRPSIRLTGDSAFSGPNIFSTANVSDTTLFFVQAYVSVQPNFVVSLNGQNVDLNGPNARFTYHIPWVDGQFYFDPGDYCFWTRLYAPYPVAPGVPSITTSGSAISGFPGFNGVNGFIRFDGTTAASGSRALSAPVSGGFRLGATAGFGFDGRFSEVIIYDRALSLAEIEQVECYLASKWNIAGPSGCNAVSGSVTKTSTVYPESPFYPFYVPGSDVIYSINVNYSSGNLIDKNGVLVIDQLPSNVTFFNGDYDGPGPATNPVGFTNSGTSLNWSYPTNVRFSNSATAPTTFAECAYTPTAGYDPNVRYICINPSGVFAGGSFSVQFRAQIN